MPRVLLVHGANPVGSGRAQHKGGALQQITCSTRRTLTLAARSPFRLSRAYAPKGPCGSLSRVMGCDRNLHIVQGLSHTRSSRRV
eukprot:2757457-Pyramimonas_sp.AAC.1